MSLMPLERIPDWEKRLERQNAFWERAIIDRPVVAFSVRKPDAHHPYPAKKSWHSNRDRWLDIEYIAESALARVANTEYMGDALPSVWPNFGPDIFAAFYGAELEFSEGTSWSSPILASLDDMDKLHFNEEGFYWRKLLELTDALLEIGKGWFYTGATDLHVGGDALAAFRGPEGLSFDIVERPDDVKRLLDKVTNDYLRIIDLFYQKLTANGQAFTCWFSIVSSRKWYVPSNDYSCMISSEMFNDIFLPGIMRECRHLDASIYHLDGPGALHHLDQLLQIPELNAVQWERGAGNGRATDWLHVYKRCQEAGKGIWLSIHVDELDFFMENLRPEGVYVALHGVANREHGEAVLQKIAKWR